MRSSANHSRLEAGFFQVFEYSQPRHSFKETERVIFKARSVERGISTWFGTHPNNEDNASALQRAIDSAATVCKVFIPSSIYKLKDTIHHNLRRATTNFLNTAGPYTLQEENAWPK